MKTEETERGAIVAENGKSWYVPGDVKDDVMLRRVPNLDDEQLENDGIIRFGRGFNSRDAEQRARLWARLDEVTGYDDLEYDPESASAVGQHAREARVPVVVAREGKAKIAAYLAAHGHSDTSISNALDVSESTVTQYLSDVKRGER